MQMFPIAVAMEAGLPNGVLNIVHGTNVSITNSKNTLFVNR